MAARTSRFAYVLGLVALRQRFARRGHGRKRPQPLLADGLGGALVLARR